MPLIDSTHAMEVRTQKITLDKVVSYSRDIQQSSSRITVNFQLAPENVKTVYTNYGPDYVARVVTPAVYDKFKEVFGRYTADEIVGSREKVGNQTLSAIAEELRPLGITVSAVQIENVDFTEEFEKAIEAAVKAKAEVTQAQQILLRKEVEAQQIVVQAKAEAEATMLRAEAESGAIRLRGEALAKNPRLVELTAAEKWDGKLPTSMIPGNTVPFLNIPNQGAR